MVDLRDKQSFDIVDFDGLYSFFDYLEEADITSIKFYNYDPKAGRIIVTYPIDSAPPE